uniref:Metalloendopeptidase n=1 Tax=Acanthochromis polyacanthus TaxID=80966 RepID=A0A3Q1FF56_9TELE
VAAILVISWSVVEILKLPYTRVPDVDEPPLIRGDIAISSDTDRNADLCTSSSCLCLKNADGNVYIPYYIQNASINSSREKAIIVRGLESFSAVSCIHFRPYQNGYHEWLSIDCYSYVGRQNNGAQTVSLNRHCCLYHSTVQHQLLHALGFNHEQTRSDRDNYIWGTPYDYNSYVFSKNNLPSMLPIPNSNVPFGQTTQMRQNDIIRLNRLYNCCK